jgi:hypothetical protein
VFTVVLCSSKLVVRGVIIFVLKLKLLALSFNRSKTIWKHVFFENDLKILNVFLQWTNIFSSYVENCFKNMPCDDVWSLLNSRHLSQQPTHTIAAYPKHVSSSRLWFSLTRLIIRTLWVIWCYHMNFSVIFLNIWLREFISDCFRFILCQFKGAINSSILVDKILLTFLIL